MIIVLLEKKSQKTSERESKKKKNENENEIKETPLFSTKKV